MQHRSIRGWMAGLVVLVAVLLAAATAVGVVTVTKRPIASAVLTGALICVAALLVVLFVLLYVVYRRYAALVGAVDADMATLRLRIDAEADGVRVAKGVVAARSLELERANAELARSNSDLEQFAYVASHDLQEPLRKVTSFCQLLQRRYQAILDERGNSYIEFAVDAAHRMQVLINELLRFARVGQGGGEFAPVDTGELARQAITNLGITDAGARIVCTGLPKVRGDASLLSMVFQNLIGNAVKFRGDEPPQVRVTAARDGDTWTFTVADNGIGIDPEHAERIFVIFQRLHAGDDYPGTGIGLAMCRRIVEFHGGRIWLDSDRPEDAGPGATFRFTLPAESTVDEGSDEPVSP